MIPKISIVIPCYNMGDYVKEAIESVLEYPIQSDIEIIVVNDGSNDSNFTKNILDSYKNDNICILHQENKGLGAARNNGIRIAKAPYIIPLDADNKLRLNYISKGIAILDNYPNVGLVYGDNYQFGLNCEEVKVGGFDITRLIEKNYIDACVVLRKTAWASVNGYDEMMPVMGYEDWDLNLRLFFKGWKFWYVNEIGFDYRIRGNSMLTESNLQKTRLIEYMFAKSELKQAKLLRDSVLDAKVFKQAYTNIQKRKVISFALKIEKSIKSVLKIFKK